MEMIWLNNENKLPTDEPLIAVIKHDEEHAIVALLDDGFEHSVLLRKVLGTDEDLDLYYRIIFNQEGADWTFVCPNDYKGITVKEKRIEEFYKEGYRTISRFLRQIQYPEVIEIPKRYRRHMDYITNGEY